MPRVKLEQRDKDEKIAASAVLSRHQVLVINSFCLPE